MKIVLAGAFGNLGAEILKQLVAEGHEVIAAGRKEKLIPEAKGKYLFSGIEITNPLSLSGLCEGADCVISTIGLTVASSNVDCYDIDYQGNMHLLAEAKRAGVKKFIYVSVIACDLPEAESVPMLHAKYMFEQELKKSGLSYVIHRPTGYFYDIVKVFRPYVERGKMQLLKGYGHVKANVVDCPDFAEFIVKHLDDENCTYEVGGKETYTYEEMSKLCFEAAGKPNVIQYVPRFMFRVLANLPKIKRAGKHDIILFSDFTLSHDLVGKDVTGEASFAEYIRKSFESEAQFK